MAHILSVCYGVLKHPSLCDPSIDKGQSIFKNKAATAFAPHGMTIVVGKAHRKVSSVSLIMKYLTPYALTSKVILRLWSW